MHSYGQGNPLFPRQGSKVLQCHNKGRDTLAVLPFITEGADYHSANLSTLINILIPGWDEFTDINCSGCQLC